MRISLITAACLFVTLFSQAQPSSGGPAPAPAPSSVPIDGGASLFLAGGAAYIVRRIKQRRRS